MGSTPAARRAGIHAAATAIIAISTGTSPNVRGSSALTSNKKLCRTRLSATAPASPATHPASARNRLCRTTPITICHRLRAQRQAQSDLPRTPAHDVRNQAIYAHRANHNRQPAETKQQTPPVPEVQPPNSPPVHPACAPALPARASRCLQLRCAIPAAVSLALVCVRSMAYITG